jgi:hypothetical protein
VLAHDEAEGGVADEGQRSVVRLGRVLIGPRGVGQRAQQEIGVGEAMTEPELQFREGGRVTVDAWRR